MPSGRILWTVTMKFRPVKIDEKPRMKTPIVMLMTAVPVVVEYGV